MGCQGKRDKSKMLEKAKIFYALKLRILMLK
jgi:hypothetical protein